MANLKEIDCRLQKAEVGYRIAERYTGKGIASNCLRELIFEARARFGLQSLYANVLDNNPASKRVLEKQGFRSVGYEPEFFEIDGILWGCTTLKLRLKE